MRLRIEPLAEKLQVDLDLLGILCRSWNSIDRDHYRQFAIPKKNGSKRIITAPKDALKCVQKAIYREILATIPLHPACHGFVRGRSIMTNASPHTGKEMVINLDLVDFFPSISAGRIHGVFVSLGFETEEARFLTRLVTFAGALPQGAPSSPTLANIVSRRLDSRLNGVANKFEANYSRYADDLTFSGSVSIIKALPLIRAIINAEGFSLTEHKLRIQRNGRRQEVTGLTTNSGVAVPRQTRRRLRSVMHHLRAGKLTHWNEKPLSREAIKGHVAFLRSIHRDLGNRMWYDLMSDDHKLVQTFVDSIKFVEPGIETTDVVTWRSDDASCLEDIDE